MENKLFVKFNLRILTNLLLRKRQYSGVKLMAKSSKSNIQAFFDENDTLSESESEVGSVKLINFNFDTTGSKTKTPQSKC